MSIPQAVAPRRIASTSLETRIPMTNSPVCRLRSARAVAPVRRTAGRPARVWIASVAIITSVVARAQEPTRPPSMAAGASGSAGAVDPQPDSIRVPSIGFFLGTVQETFVLDGARVLTYGIDGSARVGLLVGRWSAAYKETEAGNRSYMTTFPPPPPGPGMAASTASASTANLTLRTKGLEVGRRLPDRWFLQPAIYATVGSAEAERSGLKARTPIFELTGAAAVTPWILRIDWRAGVRVGKSIHLGEESVRTTTWMVDAAASFGWFADWRCCRRKERARRAAASARAGDAQLTSTASRGVSPHENQELA